MMRYFKLVCTIALVAGMLERPSSYSSAADDKADWGTVQGKVVFKGTVPKPELVKVTKDQKHCLSKGPIFDDKWVINKKAGNGVRYAFVWLTPEEGKSLPIHPSLKGIKKKQQEIDQPCCQFVPHCLAMRVGQELLVKNSAPISHNVNCSGGGGNDAFNFLIPTNKGHLVKELKATRLPMTITCNIHGWMKAWVFVFDHPYYAVTDKKGEFVFKNAPAGKYRLMGWHEEVGWLAGKKGISIEIKGGAITTKNLDAKPE